MTTPVDPQRALLHLLQRLLELEGRAAEAYQEAIPQLGPSAGQAQLRRFLANHRQHLRDLSRLVAERGTPPRQREEQSAAKRPGASGARALLSALKRREDEIDGVYERACAEPGLPDEVRLILELCLADGRCHRAWLMQRIEASRLVAPRSR